MSTPNTQAGMFSRRLLVGGAVAAIAMSFALTALVMANNLHQAKDLPISWDNPNFQGSGDDCKDADLAAGEVLWHFVHTGNDGADLPATLDATFTDAGPQQADGYSNGNGNATLMYDIITGHDTLESASDSINDDNLLNLSHICAGPEESVAESASAEQSVEGSVAESEAESVAESAEQSVEGSTAESEAESIAESEAESESASAEQSVEGSVAESEAESIAESEAESESASAEQSVEGSVAESESAAESAEQSVEASAESVAESAEQSVEASAESVAESASAEQSVHAGTGTPVESQPDGAFSLIGSGLATIAFSLILLASLGTLAYANVQSVRNRNR